MLAKGDPRSVNMLAFALFWLEASMQDLRVMRPSNTAETATYSKPTHDAAL
jgi:hypothetical protein